jgi:streptogramin lyase
VAVDSSGNVYVDGGCPSGIALGTACGFTEELLAVNGSIPASPNMTVFGSNLASPAGIAVDGSGNVYVADTGNNAIEEALAINGSYSVNSAISRLYTFAGTRGPAGVAVDGSGNVYVSDIGSNTVYEILEARSSIYAPYTAITLSGNFNYPYGVAVDGSGNVYVGDTMNNRVVKISPLVANFGQVNIGATSPAIPLTFTFDSAGTLGSTAVLTQGATGLDFANAGTGTCTANTTYTAGETCTINVTFTPKFAGSRYGAAVLYNSSGTAIATGYLQGAGGGPQINFLPGTESTVASSGLIDPYGVAVDGSGNVYIADSANNRILKESLSGGVYHESTIPTSNLNFPLDLAVDASGNVYISDTYNYRVLKETPTTGGYIETAIVDFLPDDNEPLGIAVDGDGNVYFTTSYGILYVETLSAGAYTQSTIETGSSDLGNISVDGNGVVYIADQANDRVLLETPSANGYTQSTLSANGLGIPTGIAVDGNGNVYIADPDNNTVLKETASATGYTQSTVSTTALNIPQGIAVDSDGNVYIADTGNFRILKENFADAPRLSFASTTFGATSADSPQTVTVENVGNAPLTFPILSTRNNPSITANFTLDDNGTSACPLLSGGSSEPGTLAAGASCQLSISFVPAAVGYLFGSIGLTDNNLNAGAPFYSTQNITLFGIATQAMPTITWIAPAAITYGTPLSAMQLNATSNVAGNFSYSQAAGTVLWVGQQTLTAFFTPTDTTDYTMAMATVTLTVNQATPTITWAAPLAITYGTPLSATQLNASSNVAGSFTYSPVAGTVLGTGAHMLTVTFTPFDLTDYTTATATVTLTVSQATPTVTWATPAAITYGTPLSRRQLNANSTIPGTFTYSPAAGTVLGAGQQTLTVTFTPADTTDYTTATTTVTLAVNPATPKINWDTPEDIRYGTPLGGRQLNARSTVAGSFTYSPAAGTVLGIGHHMLTATFTPTDGADYTSATDTVTLTVLR